MCDKNMIMKLFDMQVDNYVLEHNITVTLQYTSDMSAGNSLSHHTCDKHDIMLGTGTSFESEDSLILNSVFTKLCVALFREFGHCDQFVSCGSMDIVTSIISVYRNETYHEANKNVLLHEIDAEYTGIINTWNILDKLFGKISDIFIFDYMRERINGKAGYMITEPNERFSSREQIERLFKQAFENSMQNPRHFSLTELGEYEEKNDIVRILTEKNSKGQKILPDYTVITDKIMSARTGLESDKMIASLMLYVYPELKTLFQQVR